MRIYTVINGSSKGFFKYVKNKLPRRKLNEIYLIDTSEEIISVLRKYYPETKAYYIYDPKDLIIEKTNRDIKPNMKLYDMFVKVSTNKD